MRQNAQFVRKATLETQQVLVVDALQAVSFAMTSSPAGNVTANISYYNPKELSVF